MDGKGGSVGKIHRIRLERRSVHGNGGAV